DSMSTWTDWHGGLMFDMGLMQCVMSYEADSVVVPCSDYEADQWWFNVRTMRLTGSGG
ncbi:hypothetical protein J6590_031993, partial [Homalodisca vitripennis]